MTRQIWIRDTDGDLIDPLDAEAARRGIDRSKLCRVLLREALTSLAATQARMGVVLDRAHEASGLDPARFASREVPRVGDTVERAGATLQITAIDPPRSGALAVNASEFHLLRRGGA